MENLVGTYLISTTYTIVANKLYLVLNEDLVGRVFVKVLLLLCSLKIQPGISHLSSLMVYFSVKVFKWPVCSRSYINTNFYLEQCLKYFVNIYLFNTNTLDELSKNIKK